MLGAPHTLLPLRRVLPSGAPSSKACDKKVSDEDAAPLLPNGCSGRPLSEPPRHYGENLQLNRVVKMRTRNEVRNKDPLMYIHLTIAF